MTHARPLRIDVCAPSRTYPVLVGSGSLTGLRDVLDEVGCGTTRFVVSNQTVWGFWGSALREVLPEVETILLPDGERFKTLPSTARIYDALLKASADRSAGIVTFGGGVIGDIGGFAAATYLRGLALAHVRRRSWPRWMQPSAAKSASTSREERTWSARSTSPQWS